MNPLPAYFPSCRLVLFRICAIDTIVVVRPILLVGAGLAGVPHWDIISTVATHIPIVEVLNRIWSIVARLLLLVGVASWWRRDVANIRHRRGWLVLLPVCSPAVVSAAALSASSAATSSSTSCTSSSSTSSSLLWWCGHGGWYGHVVRTLWRWGLYWRRLGLVVGLVCRWLLPSHLALCHHGQLINQCT
jgi:hypothetical protein